MTKLKFAEGVTLPLDILMQPIALMGKGGLK